MTPQEIMAILDNELYAAPGSHPDSHTVYGMSSAATRLAGEIRKQNAEYIEALREIAAIKDSYPVHLPTDLYNKIKHLINDKTA